jgi:hypothetical protein
MDGHRPGGGSIDGVGRHQEDLRFWFPDHPYLDPTIGFALAWDLDWRPPSQMLDTAERSAILP